VILKVINYDNDMLALGSKKKSKSIPVTSRGGVQGHETPRIPHFLDKRLTDGGKVVGLGGRPRFTPQENSWHSFLLEAESTPGHSAAERIESMKKSMT
jgi:hypothetical protein